MIKYFSDFLEYFLKGVIGLILLVLSVFGLFQILDLIFSTVQHNLGSNNEQSYAITFFILMIFGLIISSAIVAYQKNKE